MFFEKSLSNNYEGIHHSILRLLIELSKDNLTQSILLDDSIVKRESRVKIDSIQEVEKMRELLKAMDEEIAERKETAEEESIEEEKSDLDDDNTDKGDIQIKATRHFLSSNSMLTEKLDKITITPKPASSHIYSSAHLDLNVFFGGFPFQTNSSFDLTSHC